MSGNGIATCKKVTHEVFVEMKKLVRECEYRFKSIAPRQVSLPNTGYLLCFSVSNVEQKKRNGMNGPIDRAFQKEAREQCDVEVARMFYTVGLSFHLAMNPHYRNSYLHASALPGYVPPVWFSVPIFRSRCPPPIGKHNMSLAMYKDHCKLKMLSIAKRRFASTLVMIRRFKEVKEGLQQMMISPNWSLYKEDDVGKASAVKENILDEYFWDEIDYILSFTASMHEMIRMIDTDKPFLHLVYDDRKGFIVQNGSKKILAMLLHTKSPRLQWKEKSVLRNTFWMTRLKEISMWSMPLFQSTDAMNDRFHMEPMVWWIVHGASTPTVTTRFENKEYSRIRSPSYKEGVTQTWDVREDGFDSLGEEGVRMLEIANLSFNEPSLEVALFTREDNTNRGLGENPILLYEEVLTWLRSWRSWRSWITEMEFVMRSGSGLH
ncbi:unnamed protein product [Prunus brigantina]